LQRPGNRNCRCFTGNRSDLFRAWRSNAEYFFGGVAVCSINIRPGSIDSRYLGRIAVAAVARLECRMKIWLRMQPGQKTLRDRVKTLDEYTQWQLGDISRPTYEKTQTQLFSEYLQRKLGDRSSSA